MFRTVLEQKIRERRQTFEEFAEYAEEFAREHGHPGTLSPRHLQRLVAGRGPKGQPLGSVRPATARLLESIFDVSVGELLAAPDPTPGVVQPDFRTMYGPDLTRACAWLDEHAGWAGETSRREVGSRLARLRQGEVLDRQMRRAKIGRSRVVEALRDYYRTDAASEYDLYRVRCSGRDIATSVISRLEWLDLACPLTPETDRLALVDIAHDDVCRLDPRCAVDRLAETAALDVRIANAPIYRLMSIDTGRLAIAGSVGMSSFLEYALSADVLEGELLDAITASTDTVPGALRMRDACLPDLASVLSLSERLCAGGVVALCAIARPGDPYRGGRDYALLVQERSGEVLNASRTLAVIPKGFHQPLTDVRADARIGATLSREMDEELFGRVEVDSTCGDHRSAVPMHPARLSEPLRWLTDDSQRMRMECTGFGLNLVSGNYEFACLVVIEDEDFWCRYGGDIEANWEASGLRLYSSLDHDLLTELLADESWSNEGLFAFAQGLARLSEIGGGRVDSPLRKRMASAP